MNYQIKPLIKGEKEAINYAIKLRANKKDWYVLKYDTRTTEYNNEIVFKTLAEAYDEFVKSEPSYLDERIELIFAPEENDVLFGDNMVINYK